MRHLLPTLLLTWMMVIGAPAWSAGGVDTASDPQLEARVNRLAAELRCLVCQNQSLADSHADLAIDLKNQVREQLRGGRTEAQVIEYMTQRYGDFVLYRPPVKSTTLLLWLGPALLFVGAMALLAVRLRATRKASKPQPAVDDAAWHAAADLLRETPNAPLDRRR